MHLANRVGEAHHSKLSTITAYGIDEATDIAQLVYPTSSQHSLVPGIPTSPESFRLDLLDAFGQMVSTTHGSGVRCSLSWDPSVEQVSPSPSLQLSVVDLSYSAAFCLCSGHHPTVLSPAF